MIARSKDTCNIQLSWQEQIPSRYGWRQPKMGLMRGKGEEGESEPAGSPLRASFPPR